MYSASTKKLVAIKKEGLKYHMYPLSAVGD